MTGHNPKIDVLTGPERRRRWSTAEKLTIVQETYEADATVSLVARRYGIQPNQLFTWRKLAAQGAFTATDAQDDVVPASAAQPTPSEPPAPSHSRRKRSDVTIELGRGRRVRVDSDIDTEALGRILDVVLGRR